MGRTKSVQMLGYFVIFDVVFSNFLHRCSNHLYERQRYVITKWWQVHVNQASVPIMLYR